MIHRADAATYTYTVPSRWWQPTRLPFIHHALFHMPASTDFAYMLGDNTTQGCMLSDVVLARSPPSPGALPLQVALMADVGSIEILGFATWRELARRSTFSGGSLEVDLAVHAGDVSYAGTATAIPCLNVTQLDEWEPLWDCYGVAHDAFTRHRPYVVGIGNHEAWYNWTAVLHRYPSYQQLGQGRDEVRLSRLARPPFWFSFESGGVHFTMLSSEHEYAAGSLQHAFATSALAAVNRTRTPWSVVAFHRPMYCSDAAGYNSSRPGGALQAELESLLLHHTVDVVVSGHEHGYERIHPNVAGQPVSMPTVGPAGEPLYHEPSAPVYLVVGHGGAAQLESWVTPAPSWSARRMSQGCDFSDGGAVDAASCAPVSAARGLASHGRRAYTDTFGWAHAAFTNRTHARIHTEMISGHLGDVFWIVRRDNVQQLG